MNTETERKAYEVVGYCFVPNQVRIKVTARNEQEAMRIAKEHFNTTRHKRSCIVGGTADETSAHGFEPFDAKEVQP